MKIKKIYQEFSVCQVEDYSCINLEDEYIFTGKTKEENSLVCSTDKVPSNAIQCDGGWSAFCIQGNLDFSLIGVLANISGILADNGISIFAISTYNTDYILIKKEYYQKGIEVLKSSGYEILD